MSKANKKTILLVVWLALLGGLFFAITQLNNRRPAAAGQSPRRAPLMTPPTLQQRWPEIVAHAAAPPRGDPNARYTLVEFGDFQCPQCGKARPIIEALLAQAPDQVNLLFFHRPFPNMHQWALPAAEASEVAAAQGKFWPMYDTLYSHQDDLEPGYYADYAADIGLDGKFLPGRAAPTSTRPRVTQAPQARRLARRSRDAHLLVRDNATGRITLYVGLDSTLPGAPVGFPGIKQLAANPPWLAAPKTARK